MNSKSIYMVSALLCLTNEATAQQTPREQAQEMLGGVSSYTDNFDQTTVETVVVPFETSAPPETSIDDASMEATIIERISGDSAESQVLSDTRASFANRPEVVLDPNGELFERASYADENADSLLGGYFEGGGGLCEAGDFGLVETFQRLCRRYKDTTVESCSIYSDIWVDRFDSYICEAQDARYLKQCDQTTSYSCEPTTGCITNALSLTTIAPSQVSYTSSGAKLTHSGVTSTSCIRQNFQYNLGISTDFQMASLMANTLQYVGFAQVLVNGKVMGTYPSGGTNGELISKSTKISKNVTRNVPTLKITNSSGAISYTTLSTSCSNTSRSSSINQDIIGLINQVAPVGMANPQIGSNTITLRVVTTGKPLGSMNLSYDGACCDALQKTLETTCAPISR